MQTVRFASSLFLPWPTVIPPTYDCDWDWSAQLGILNTDAHAFGTSRSNAHDGTFKLAGNTYAFSIGTLTHIEHYYEDSVNYFEGNTYAQLPGFSWFENFNYGLDENGNGGYRKRYLDAEEAIKGLLHDEEATLITFD